MCTRWVIPVFSQFSNVSVGSWDLKSLCVGCLGSHFWHKWHFCLWHHCCTVFHYSSTLHYLHGYFLLYSRVNMSKKLFHPFPINFYKGHLYGRVFVHISPPSPSSYASNVIFLLPMMLFSKFKIYFATIITWMLTHIEMEPLAAAWNRINRRTIQGFRTIIAISQYFPWDSLPCLLIAYNAALYANFKPSSFKCLIPDCPRLMGKAWKWCRCVLCLSKSLLILSRTELIALTHMKMFQLYDYEHQGYHRTLTPVEKKRKKKTLESQNTMKEDMSIPSCLCGLVAFSRRTNTCLLDVSSIIRYSWFLSTSQWDWKAL